MQFTVNRSDLSAELALLQGAIERKTTIPILSNVLVEAEGDKLRLLATDLEISLVTTLPARVKMPGSLTIPAKRFADYIRLLPDGDIEIQAHENAWVSTVRARSRMRMAGLTRESFPDLPALPEHAAEIPAASFAELIQRVVFAISTEESRFTLKAAQMIIAKGNLTLVATDGHRLAIASMELLDSDAENTVTLVSRKALVELLKLCAGVDEGTFVRYAEDKTMQFFEVQGRVLSARKVTGNFPDYKRVLPKDQPHAVVVDRMALIAALKRVEQFADERSLCVKIDVGKDELTCTSSLSDVGECVESLPVEYQGQEVAIGFNARYWLDFLGVVAASQVRFLFKDGNSAGELRPGSGADDKDKAEERYRYVVMPMRV